MKTVNNAENSRHDATTDALGTLLRQRYGDGTIYLCTPAQRLVLEQAQWRGYVSMEGQITPFGMRYLIHSGE